MPAHQPRAIWETESRGAFSCLQSIVDSRARSWYGHNAADNPFGATKQKGLFMYQQRQLEIAINLLVDGFLRDGDHHAKEAIEALTQVAEDFGEAVKELEIGRGVPLGCARSPSNIARAIHSLVREYCDLMGDEATTKMIAEIEFGPAE